MPSNRVRVSLALIAAAVLAAGCGDSGKDGGVGCTLNSDCASNQICHPIAKFCVKTCNSVSDCTGTGNTLCQSYTWVPSLPDGGIGAYPPDAGPITTGSTKICQCPSTSVCQGTGGTSANAICGDEDKVCETRCVSDSDCQFARRCQASTGQCRTIAACNASNQSLGPSGGPDICQYGQFCQAGACAAAPIGTCSQAQSSMTPPWDQTSRVAPVITSVTATALSSTNPMTECLNGDPAALLTINWYAPQTLTTHTGFPDLQNHVKFSVSVSAGYFGANFSRSNPPANQQFGSMQVGIGCGIPHGTASLYIADEAGHTSNVVCVTW